ncbi:methyltransferase domain-containing protein [Paraflavitalea speifideaquila]|uniref:methyltransferase domain-containing protein n=1 Tax=Paraflavitalea speifideaquila TaxID=3076558 RepID=UPI0028E91721|nr:methyltransferase domain-containing protein [Paraflavitalea speifideiaquila]
MSKQAAFDVLAADYDTSFSHSLTGHAQRMVSRAWLQSFLAGKGTLRILEINCGTGEDALWLASLGHTVIATDQSERMIGEAREKQLLAWLVAIPCLLPVPLKTWAIRWHRNALTWYFPILPA